MLRLPKNRVAPRCDSGFICLFSSPGQSPGRPIVLPLALAAVALAKSYVKVFYVMGNALSGELSFPFDRSCLSHCCHILIA